MKIYIPFFEEDIHEHGNPYVYTLTDYIQRKYIHISFYFDKMLLWKNECETFDIIHFMWPQIHANEVQDGYNIEQRLIYLKSKGIKIISTCHNFAPHYFNEISTLCYNVVYKYSDCIIHLGEYSKKVMQQQYLNAMHVLIPHHVYNTIYGEHKSKKESRKTLGIRPESKVALCVGNFRSEEEKKLIREASKELFSHDIIILAPRLFSYSSPINNNMYSWFKVILKNPYIWFKKMLSKRHGLLVKGSYIDDEELMTYMGAADIVIIQRTRILNSGNLPLGMYMAKVVVGPNVGNVGQILQDTDNPVFNPNDKFSICDAICRGFDLACNGKGKANKDWIMKSCTTEIVAQQHYELYKSLKVHE